LFAAKSKEVKTINSTYIMNIIDPETRCLSQYFILGPDGCVYKYVDNMWKTIFVFDNWKTYVTNKYNEYITGTIDLNNFVDSLTYDYKSASGYTGELTHHMFGSCQYHSIWKMFMTLQILTYCQIDIKKIINGDPSDFLPSANYRENLLNKLKVTAYKYCKPDTSAQYGLYNDNIVTNPWSSHFNEQENDAEPQKVRYFYCYLPGPKRDSLSDSHRIIYDKKITEYKQYLIDKFSSRNFPEEESQRIINRFTRDIELKHKIDREKDKGLLELSENDIMWEDDDLIDMKYVYIFY
jgi:hypothetical protein